MKTTFVQKQKEEQMSDWVGIFIILISLFCGGFALGVKWGEPMLDSLEVSTPAQPDVPDTTVGNMISRQATIDALASAMPSLTTPDGCGEFDHEIQIADEVFVDAMQIIHNMPSVEAEPVRHGHWIRGSGYPHHIFCSICYATYVPNDEWDIWKTDGSDCFRLQRNFCPHCGAKMDEVEQ